MIHHCIVQIFVETFIVLVEITTVSTRAGRPLRYSMLTGIFRRAKEINFLGLRISARRCVKRWLIGWAWASILRFRRKQNQTSALVARAAGVNTHGNIRRLAFYAAHDREV